MGQQRSIQYDVVERAIDIPAPAADVAALITDLRRWQEWSPWEDLDPKLSRKYSGPESGVGAHYEWNGNRKAGAGTMEITAVDPRTIAVDLTFTRPFKSAAKITFVLAPTADGTHVVWRMRSPRTLMTKAMGLVYKPEKLIGPDLDKGLQNLAAVAG